MTILTATAPSLLPTSLSEAIAQIDYWKTMALTDALTGLATRRALELHVRQLTTEGQSFCLLLVDVDKFKTVNDTAGHREGDRLLTAVAQILSEACLGGMAARIGGDEFACTLEKGQSAKEVATRIKAAVQALPVPRQTLEFSPEYLCSVSIGSAIGSRQSLSSSLQEADERMYLEKISRSKLAW